MKLLKLIFLLGIILLSACSLVINKASSNIGNGLSDAIRNAKDPELVKSALPSYILFSEGLLENDPDNMALKAKIARLYNVYLGLFEHSESTRKALSSRALHYSESIACHNNQNFCQITKAKYDFFKAQLVKTNKEDINWLYQLAISWGQYIEANKDD